MKLLWLTDIHLDQADSPTRRTFYEKLRAETFDAAIITGDISIARLLATHLGELAQACAPRRVYFVLGNHDFFGSSFDAVEQIAATSCMEHPNLQQLGWGEMIRLDPSTALIGHRGWADGRAFGGRRTSRRFPDQNGIRDLRFRSTYPAFRKMEQMGRESSVYFRKLLPSALTRYRHVMIATHVPVFARAVRFNGKPCTREMLPHFVNALAGSVIQRIGEHFPNTRISVLCGHTHHGNAVKIGSNIEIRVGLARKGSPTIQAIIDL